MMNTALDDTRKEQQKTSRNILKGERFLFLKNYDSLDVWGKERLNALLAANEPLFLAHSMKEHWCTDALIWGSKPLRKVAKSLWNRSEGILSYFKHRISNGKAEGINNKIKTLKRQAYGFRVCLKSFQKVELQKLELPYLGLNSIFFHSFSIICEIFLVMQKNVLQPSF